MEGTVVSRRDLYQDQDEDGTINTNGASAYPPIAFDFVEVRPDSQEPRDPASDAEPELLEFQLFGGSGPINVNLEEKEEVFKQERPISYYIYSATPSSRAQALAAAVSGEFILEEAVAQARRSRGPIARDVNADWRPAKRRCRPGKEARRKKKLRNERIEADRKAEAERWQQRRRAFKPRGSKPRRPETGFTFK